MMIAVRAVAVFMAGALCGIVAMTMFTTFGPVVLAAFGGAALAGLLMAPRDY